VEKITMSNQYHNRDVEDREEDPTALLEDHITKEYWTAAVAAYRVNRVLRNYLKRLHLLPLLKIRRNLH